MTKQDVFGRDLVFEVVVEGKPVLWFPIWHFVPPEPVDRGLQVTRFQALNVADVWTQIQKQVQCDWWRTAHKLKQVIKWDAHCSRRWLQGPLHWLQSLSNQSRPHRSWPGRRAPSLWLPRHGNTPGEDISICTRAILSFSMNSMYIQRFKKDNYCHLMTKVKGEQHCREIISQCCTLLPISHTSMGSLSPQQSVSLSLCAGSSHVWNITNKARQPDYVKLLINAVVRFLGSNKNLTWGIAP